MITVLRNWSRTVTRENPKLYFLIFLIHSALCQDEIQTATVTNFEGFGDLTNVIATDKTKANLSCESGDMVVKLQFSEKFRGVIYADRDRQSACKKYGDGSSFYVFQIPLQGCGTKERVTADYRMFVNDIIVRFHPNLELEGDEVKTILCRYPPPVAPLPPVIVPLPAEAPAVIAAGPRQLSEVELMLIICAILFLALLLLGIGFAYYCLKKRNIKIIKHRKTPSGPPSQITKLSGSTLGPLSIPFDGIRIPRVTAHSVSGSEALLTIAEQSDTITEYPSESPSSTHSDMEVETRVTTSCMTQSAYDNQAYEEERSYPPQPMPRTSRSHIVREERTRYEEEETRRTKTLTHQRITQSMHHQQQQQQQQQEQYHHYSTEPAGYSRIRRPRVDDINDEKSSETTQKNERSITETTREISKMYSLPTETDSSFTQLRTTSEQSQEFHSRQTTTKATAREITEARSARSVSEIIEPPATLALETIDTNSTYDQDSSFLESISYEEQLKITRENNLLQSYIQEPPIPEFDVTIRNYPPVSEAGNESSKAGTLDQLSMVSERPQVLFEDIEDSYPVLNPTPNWDVLVRVLEPPPTETHTSEDIQSIFSENDRDKWRDVLSTDNELRTLISEARTSEEFEHIRYDERYEKLFSPPAWDIVIRILTNPMEFQMDNDTASISDTASYTSERPAANFRRKSDAEMRNRRMSLPPLYEQDISRSTEETTVDDVGCVRYEQQSIYSQDSQPDDRRQLFIHHDPSLPTYVEEEMQSSHVEKFSSDYSPLPRVHFSTRRQLERSSTEVTVREVVRMQNADLT